MVTLPLAHVDAASARQRLLTIDLSGHAFEYVPGQAVRIAPHGVDERRPYSIACSPERAAETRAIQLLIALEGGAEDLHWATRGALIDVEGPIGTFTFPASLDDPWVLFVAGGTASRGCERCWTMRCAATVTERVAPLQQPPERRIRVRGRTARARATWPARAASDGDARREHVEGRQARSHLDATISRRCCTSRPRRSVSCAGRRRSSATRRPRVTNSACQLDRSRLRTGDDQFDVRCLTDRQE